MSKGSVSPPGSESSRASVLRCPTGSVSRSSDSAVVAVSDGVEVAVSGEVGAGEVVDGVVLPVGVDATSAAGVQETSNDPHPASSTAAAVSAAAAVARVLLVRPIRPLRPVHWRNHRPPAEGMRVGVRQSTRRS